MSKVKTAISIEESVLEETDHIAQELDIPRSQWVALALVDFNQRYRNKQLLAQINAAYTTAPDSDETGTLQVIRSHRKKLGWQNLQQEGGEEWK
jgi:metal-responsive CopG/Arc/MetJ family transcriptional regulator